MRFWMLLSCGVGALVGGAAGCALQPTHLDLGPDGDGDGGGGETVSGSGGAGGTGGSSSTPIISDAGLPCEVSFLLVQYCRGCHSNPPIAGATTPMMTYEDLLASMPGDPSTTVAEASLARMMDAQAPMPPGNLLSSAEVAPFAAWVSAQMPPEVCETDGTTPDPATNPYDTPAVCTSGTFWTQGDEGSPNMLPGTACIACHSGPGGDEGPRFLFSGTVYPTAHEPDNCHGVGGVQIEITDANGLVRTVNALDSGNFFSNGDGANLVTPITARVLQGDKVLPMVTPVDTGDCNTCHTQEGKEGAPGRIILPW